jgi:hypothetical protein
MLLTLLLANLPNAPAGGGAVEEPPTGTGISASYWERLKRDRDRRRLLLNQIEDDELATVLAFYDTESLL